MRNKHLTLKLLSASLCVVFAYNLPLSLTKPHEISFRASHFKPVPALAVPKMHLASYLSPVAVPAPIQAPQAAYTGTGDANLDYIVQHESSGNPYAVNSIGACGLFQSLPCAKMGCSLNDVACQLAWGKQYAIARYGSTAAAASFWQSHRYW